MTRIVKVTKLPDCDMCKDTQATYDARISTGGWGFLCYDCFQLYGVGLGLGKGQKLEVER